VSIVGRDLRYVEQVTGRMGWPEAMLRGALSGALAGLLIGWLFFVFDWFDPLVARGWLIFDGFWFGTVVGALMGLLTHALLRGRRDFASVPAIVADRYDVVADPELVDEATRLLNERRSSGDDEARFERTPSDATTPSSPAGPAPPR
jgi:hypothetical protein